MLDSLQPARVTLLLLEGKAVDLRDGSGTAAFRVEESEIEQQVSRLLSNNHFCNSKRLPSFLRFVVGETIKGRGESLKERTIGATVFGRPATYDTAGDPIVRVAATELRKRLALYYQDPGHESEIRISLPIGSYIPRFDLGPTASPARAREVNQQSIKVSKPTWNGDSVPADEVAVEPLPPTDSRFRRGRPVLVTLALLAFLCLAVTLFYFIHRIKSPLEEFWSPALNSDDAITFYLPYLPTQPIPNAPTPAASSDTSEISQMPRPGKDAVELADFRSYVTLTSFLESRHRKLLYESSNTSTIADLKTGPAILIGAFDNPWALRSTSALRFRFGNDPDMQELWIEDTFSHSKTRWSVDRRLQATNNYDDYAIVARYLDQDTGKPVVLVAGITGPGTTAASEFITDSDQLSRIPGAPRTWAQKNIEVVLKIQIIDREPATPKVVAAYFW